MRWNFPNYFGSGFEPNYCVYKNNDKLYVKCDTSSKLSHISIDYEYIDGYANFTISGKKEIKFPYEVEKTYFYQNKMKLSFNIKLTINNELILENFENPKFEKVNIENGSGGIYTFSYNL